MFELAIWEQVQRVLEGLGSRPWGGHVAMPESWRLVQAGGLGQGMPVGGEVCPETQAGSKFRRDMMRGRAGPTQCLDASLMREDWLAEGQVYTQISSLMKAMRPKKQGSATRELKEKTCPRSKGEGFILQQ